MWSNLQYLMGLMRLGHDVYFLEDSDDYPSCYDPKRDVTDADPTYGIKFAGRSLDAIGFGDRWAFYDAHRTTWLGPCADRISEICGSADLLLNLAGANPVRPWVQSIPNRAFVDEDPAFTQIKHLSQPDRMHLASQHTAFLTFAENINSDQCTIPSDGLPWIPTRQPVVLDTLPITPGRPNGKFTTVMLWESYTPLNYEGRNYGMKSESFRPYMDLPTRTAERLELALGGGKPPRELLQKNGWTLIDPRQPTIDPSTYERYVRDSKGEFSVAKHGYVVSRSGWFSERSVCYLASGRPVIVQDTGFSDWLPTGVGVIGFTNPEEALAGIEDVADRYNMHCKAAREIAEQYFESKTILIDLIDKSMNSGGA